jgi:hypothetical protein
LSYLRFTPDEYRTIADLCRELDLCGRHQPAFHRLLVQALRDVSPALATRIARLGRTKVGVLYWHFRERPTIIRTPPQFTAQDMRLLAEACHMVPFRVRQVRPFKHVLIELFQEEWPALARKLTRLSGCQFEEIYEQVVCQRRQDPA